MSKRTAATQKLYDEARKDGTTILRKDSNGNCYFDWEKEVAIQEWNNWVLLSNRFPYDKIFLQHDILLPKKRVAFIRQMSKDVLDEYFLVKKEIDEEQNYNSIVENFSTSRSVKQHFHAHLVVWKGAI